jgi:hypothetical protein
MGDDECVIYGGISGRIAKQDIMAQSKAEVVCSKVLQMTKAVGANHITIDCDGLGGPIADFIRILKPDSITLEEVYSSSTKDIDPQYQNQKAEMWFYAKEEAEAGRERIPDDEYLKQELQEMKYFINGRGKIQIEEKEDIKDRIGRSPDRADAWVLNVWGRKSSKVIHSKDTWRDGAPGDRAVSSGATSPMAA